MGSPDGKGLGGRNAAVNAFVQTLNKIVTAKEEKGNLSTGFFWEAPGLLVKHACAVSLYG